ncbi:MAG TPA: PHP domain-containing protein [Candidatus Caenarcaniphilales bacterium]
MVVNPVRQDTQSALKAVFQVIDADSCPGSYNFHMHTVHSDGQLQPEALIQQAISLGLKGLAITDHHTVRGSQIAHQWLENSQPYQVTVPHPVPILWTGVEITAELLETEIHILGYAFDPNQSQLQPYLQGRAPAGVAAQAAQVIAAIQQAGGLAVLAHPARYRRSAPELIPAVASLGIDGIETYYCYTNPKPWQPSPEQTQLAQGLGNVYGLLHTCGTDTHGLSLRQRL